MNKHSSTCLSYAYCNTRLCGGPAPPCVSYTSVSGPSSPQVLVTTNFLRFGSWTSPKKESLLAIFPHHTFKSNLRISVRTSLKPLRAYLCSRLGVSSYRVFKLRFSENIAKNSVNYSMKEHMVRDYGITI